jgi:hypothetical protein
MDNTTYEFFIRRAWECERFQKGANTDTWESLLVCKYQSENAIGDKNKEKETKKYYKELSEVKNYINNAYSRLLVRAQKSKVSLEAIKKIEELKNSAELEDNPQTLYEIMRASFQVINDNKL